MTIFFTQESDTRQRYYDYQCTTVQIYGRPKCESRSLPANGLERFTEQLLIHAAKDTSFFKAVAPQGKGDASETFVTKRVERSDLVAHLASVRKQVNTIVSILARMQLKPDDLSGMLIKIAGLKGKSDDLEHRVQTLDREIKQLERQQIDRKQLRHVLQDFSEIYPQAHSETKRRLLNIMIEEIRCSVKKGERKGDIVCKHRGDGSVRKEWKEAKM